MRRIGRLAIGFLLPPLMGALLLIIERSMPVSVLFVPFVLYGAFSFAGMQSVLYTLLMEFKINPYINNNLLAIFFSVLLAALLSLPIGLVMKSIFAINGAITGLVVGIILRWMYVKDPKFDS